jgi:hypothetical protein
MSGIHELAQREAAGLRRRREARHLQMRRRLAELLNGQVTKTAGTIVCWQSELLVPGEAGLAAQRLSLQLDTPAHFGATARVGVEQMWLMDRQDPRQDPRDLWMASYAEPLTREVGALLIPYGVRPHVQVLDDGSFTVEGTDSQEQR